jgi:23S rRNA pseudouridine2605 synthase
MLLTNDGDLTYLLTHPKFEISKTYRVVLDRQPTYQALEFMRKGARIAGTLVRPTLVEHDKDQTPKEVEITVHEGQKHLVRRMVERAGYDTVKLTRTVLGPFSVDDLDGKSYVELTSAQVQEKMKTIELPTLQPGASRSVPPTRGRSSRLTSGRSPQR